MRTITGLTIVLALALGTSACQTMETAAPAPATEPAASTQTPEMTCRMAVAGTANRDLADTAVMSVDRSRAATAVTVSLKRAERPWSCILDPDGVVQAVTYMGEG